MSCNAVMLNGLLNGVDELLVTNWFREEVHRTCLKGLHRNRNVTMSGHEHDLDWGIGLGKLLLKIEATQSWKPHIQDKAARCVRPLGH